MRNSAPTSFWEAWIFQSFIAVAILTSCNGCVAPATSLAPLPSRLPARHRLTQRSLIIHSDFLLSDQDDLVDDLFAVREELSHDLKLPDSDEPIDIYLFENDRQFRHYLDQHYPSFPNRRAFFLKSEDRLVVLAHWNPQVADDLRHEVTHACLHRVIPDLPIWLDEGLAEYYEVGTDAGGRHRQHIKLLCMAIENEQWTPDLHRLESLHQPKELTHLDYAESWAWVHFMMHHSPTTKHLLQQYLFHRRTSPVATTFASELEKVSDDSKSQLINGLRDLSNQR